MDGLVVTLVHGNFTTVCDFLHNLVFSLPYQIVEAAKVARSWQEFEALIGGSFANFDFLEDYFRLRDLAENSKNERGGY